MSVSESRIDVSLVTPKNQLKKAQIFQDILVLLKQKIAEYPATYNLKGCNDFLLYVCKVIENVVVKKQNINKKELVKDLFKSLFNLQPAELLVLDSAIQFLFDNGLIVSVPVIKKAVNWFKKKGACIF
jgi:hypothetical protein